MKKHVLFLIPLALVYTSCPPTTIYQQSTGSSSGTYKEYPVSVDIQGEDMSKGVEVFEAEVSVYRMNNRTDPALRLEKTYNLLIQEADGERITRIDYTDDHPAEYRSMISTGDSAVLFNPVTGEISQKISIDQPQNPAYRLLSSQNYLSKINLSLVRQEAMRLAFDVQTDDADTLTLAIPSDLAQMTHGDRRVNTKISFRVKDEVLASTETITTTAGGALVTTTVTPQYERVDGVPIKTGQTTVTKVDMPRISGVPYEGDIYNSPDEIPTISREEYESLRNKGLIHERAGLVFGDPNDLSYVETEVELYNTVKVNHAPAMAYKLPWWLKVVVTIVDPAAGLAIIIADEATSSSPIPNPPPMPDGYRGHEEAPAIDTTKPVTQLSGDELLAKVNSGEINGYRYYFFNGFDFKNYKASRNGITDIIQDEYQVISRGGTYTNKDSEGTTTVVKSDEDYVIIGHSEGGLRALAYASYIEKYHPDEYSKLKGVITISGANKGFKALEGGIDVFKYKLYNMIDILANGLASLDILNIMTPPQGVDFSSATLVYSLQDPVVRYFLNLIPGPLSNYIIPILSANNNYDNIAEIRDLVPFSRFANTYVADAKVEIKKREVGTFAQLELLPLPHIAYRSVYEYYTVYYDEKIQFLDENLPVAYIIGTDNDILNMIGESSPEATTAIEVLAIGFENAEIYYSVLNYSTLGLANLFTDASRLQRNARRAKEMFKDFNASMYGLLGSPKNDCLLAKESMYYEKGTILGVKEVDKNHEKIIEGYYERGNATGNAVHEFIEQMFGGAQ